ncbi:MAG TPA: YqgE/AlgH family protein [Bryobacteraceae bacterium]
MIRVALLAGLFFTALLYGADLASGKFLVASRDLGDPNFAGTVVLLLKFDEDEGALGIIVNRRTDVPLSRVFESVKSAKDRTDAVYIGGPVEPGSVIGLLKSSAKVEDASRILPGIYLISGRAPLEKTAAEAPPGAFHAYLGYAGWGPGQLENEIDLGGWRVLPADAAMVFDPDPDTLWEKLIRRTELRIAQSVRKVAIGSTFVARRAGR